MALLSKLRQNISKAYTNIDKNIFKGKLPRGATVKTSSKVPEKPNIKAENTKPSKLRTTASKVYSTIDKYAFGGILPKGAVLGSNVVEAIDKTQSFYKERSLRKSKEKTEYQQAKLKQEQAQTEVKLSQEQNKIRRDLGTYNPLEYFDKTERALNQQRRENEAANIQIDLSTDKQEIQERAQTMGVQNPYQTIQTQTQSSSIFDKFKSNIGDSIGKIAPWVLGAFGLAFLYKKK